MAYLFTHFTNNGKEDREHIWFSVSRDGLNFTDLGGDEPLLSAKKGTTGIRDPFIVYDKRLKKYFIIATDLCTTKGGNWYDYSHKGSRKLFIWESENLVDWSEERTVEVGIEKAGCVWAPEAVWCKEENKWFVFFASCVREKPLQKAKQRIYGCFTEDFITFSPTFKYIDAKTDVIDTNIIHDGEFYYRFSKDETHKFITLERSRALVPKGEEKFEEIKSDVLSSFHGVEGPEAYFVDSLNKWVLIVDRYQSGKGYIPIVCDSLSEGKLSFLPEDSYNMGKRKKRHGGIIKISDEEYDRLVDSFKIAE